ncbi:hypothetical protein HDR61_01005 [bacterium]|nr:hypothetical protein [bacterium]
MKKVLVSVVALVALAGCASYYDYYRGDVRYTQDGADCIYYAGEMGNHFSADIRSLHTGKKIVYRNTMCSDLYNRDMMGQAPRADRVIVAPAARTSSCGCDRVSHRDACRTNVRRKYIFVPAM